MEERKGALREHQGHKRHMSNRRKRALRKRRMLIGAILLCLLTIVGGTGMLIHFGMNRFTPHKAERDKAASSTAASAQTTKLVLDDAVSKNQNTEKVTDTASSNVPDRSGFAVDPNVPAGSASSTAEKVVYLTFDDGPSYNTQKVLDILDQYDAKATFFVVGMNTEYHGLIKTAYDKGHTIGLHTFSHDYAAIYASQDAYFNDLAQIGEVVKGQIGYVPCFIRFPGGSSNTISANYTQGIMTSLSQTVQTKGYQYYDWNISCGDGGVRTADELTAQATSADYDNIVLLMHDANNKETTVEALPRILEHYKALGYQFKAIDRSTFDAHHGISN